MAVFMKIAKELEFEARDREFWINLKYIFIDSQLAINNKCKNADNFKVEE